MRKILLVASLISLSGCVSNHIDKTQAAQKRDEAHQLLESFSDKHKEKSAKRVEVFENGFYLGNKSIPVSRDVMLPPVFARPFENKITLVSEGRVNLSSVAELIQRSTGIPVEITPDVYPKSNTIPSQSNLQESNQAYNLQSNLTLDWHGPLSGLLDQIGTRLGLSWEYKEGHIRFFRYLTKTYEIKALAGSKEVSSEFSSTGTVNAKAGEGGSSSSVIGVNQRQYAKLDLWSSLLSELNAYKSAGGNVVPNEAVGTMTVTDTPSVHRQIEKIIAEQNRRISRTVHFKVELVSVTAKKGNEFGLDLNLLYSDGKTRYLLNSPKGLTSIVSGQGGAAILSPSMGKFGPDHPGTLGDGFSSFGGSQTFVNALSEVAHVDMRQTLYATTINNSPVPFTMATTQSYVDSVGTSQAQTSTQITVSQKQITTGIFIELLPRLLDNNKLLLQYTVDSSILQGFDSTKTNVATLKSPIVPRRATSQTLRLSVGETVVLSAMSNLAISDGKRLSFGGSYVDTVAKENLLILITPVLVDDLAYYSSPFGRFARFFALACPLHCMRLV